jgi:CBS domain-containing protein
MLRSASNPDAGGDLKMQVHELMQPQVWETYPEEPLADAAARMQAHEVGSLAVMDREDLVGIVTERDVLRAVADGVPCESTPVSSYMTALPVVADLSTDTTEAARLMVRHDIRHLPVVVGRRLVGMVSARDLLVLDTTSA